MHVPIISTVSLISLFNYLRQVFFSSEMSAFFNYSSAGGEAVINPPPKSPTVVSTAPFTNSTDGTVFGPATTNSSGSATNSGRNSFVLILLLLSFHFGNWD